MKFGVISNISKDPEGKYKDFVCKEIKKNNGGVSFSLCMDKDSVIEDVKLKETDMIMSLGGDGTFLNIARKTAGYNIPILGINIGSLGFLAEIEVQETYGAIKKILADDYQIEKRMMVTASIKRDGIIIKEAAALNDIVISRGLLSRIVNLETYIDDSYIDSFPGDGIIVATPTGSTGYSLSAGGPVVDHGLELMVITPICPHIMHAKSFVSNSESKIKIIVNESEDYSCSLTADGQTGFELKGGDSVTVTKSDTAVSMVRLRGNTLYDTLRNKIYYRNGEKNETQQAH